MKIREMNEAKQKTENEKFVKREAIRLGVGIVSSFLKKMTSALMHGICDVIY